MRKLVQYLRSNVCWSSLLNLINGKFYYNDFDAKYFSRLFIKQLQTAQLKIHKTNQTVLTFSNKVYKENANISKVPRVGRQLCPDIKHFQESFGNHMDGYKVRYLLCLVLSQLVYEVQAKLIVTNFDFRFTFHGFRKPKTCFSKRHASIIVVCVKTRELTQKVS